jgi:hypothetical protein
VHVSRVTAIHVSSSGSILIDVLLDHAGVPDGVDMAWRTKHFLGVPVPAANLATLNLVQIVMVIEFKAAQIAESAENAESQSSDAVGIDRPIVTDAVPPQDVERAAPSSMQAAARSAKLRPLPRP